MPLLFENLYERGMRVIGALGPHMEPQHLLPGRDVSKVVRFLQRHLYRLLEDILTPHPEHFNTLCHTNLLDGSNLLFVLDQRHRPVQCRLVGLGQVRYCRPAVDLALVLYCIGDRDVRSSKVS
jgi:Ecdysteroid kinase-like family